MEYTSSARTHVHWYVCTVLYKLLLCRLQNGAAHDRKCSLSATAALSELLGHRRVRSEDMTRKCARTMLKWAALPRVDYGDANFFNSSPVTLPLSVDMIWLSSWSFSLPFCSFLTVTVYSLSTLSLTHILSLSHIVFSLVYFSPLFPFSLSLYFSQASSLE